MSDLLDISSAEAEPSEPPFDGKVDLSQVEVDYYDYDCGSPCTPHGCPGHLTDIPVSITISGVTFHVDGSERGDFPSGAAGVARVQAVVEALVGRLTEKGTA